MVASRLTVASALRRPPRKYSTATSIQVLNHILGCSSSLLSSLFLQGGTAARCEREREAQPSDGGASSEQGWEGGTGGVDLLPPPPQSSPI